MFDAVAVEEGKGDGRLTGEIFHRRDSCAGCGSRKLRQNMEPGGRSCRYTGTES
jgi:hypothetical protein